VQPPGASEKGKDFSQDAGMQFWGLVNVEMINVMSGAQVDIVERTAEAGARLDVSVISLRKIDDANDIC
jgi:hypothetical protein